VVATLEEVGPATKGCGRQVRATWRRLWPSPSTIGTRFALHMVTVCGTPV
jgi:hypothetical protein